MIKEDSDEKKEFNDSLVIINKMSKVLNDSIPDGVAGINMSIWSCSFLLVQVIKSIGVTKELQKGILLETVKNMWLNFDREEK